MRSRRSRNQNDLSYADRENSDSSGSERDDKSDAEEDDNDIIYTASHVGCDDDPTSEAGDECNDSLEMDMDMDPEMDETETHGKSVKTSRGSSRGATKALHGSKETTATGTERRTSGMETKQRAMIAGATRKSVDAGNKKGGKKSISTNRQGRQTGKNITKGGTYGSFDVFDCLLPSHCISYGFFRGSISLCRSHVLRSQSQT